MKLFGRDNTVGVFRGFSQGGMEFHADIILPYRNEFQSIPMHGQFVIVQLESEDEAVLGRITAMSSVGQLVSPAGEDYHLRLMGTDREVPEDLRERYLRYVIKIRVLGVIRVNGSEVVFVPSHRRLPHVGSKVGFPCPELLAEIAGHNLDGAELGFFALGEFIYSGRDQRVTREPWMRVMEPEVVPKFRVGDMVARRSFVFARAGFGKSNLIKLLLASLYRTVPMASKRTGEVPVGTLIFDPEGEYFWPDDKGRPGLCDVEHLEERGVVFTRKAGPSAYYQSFVASDIRLDLRRFRPGEVIGIALSPEKQEQQNVRKLKGLNDNDWRELVDEIYNNGNAADGALIRRLLRLEDSQEAEMVAARANMTTIVKAFHDPSSQMMDMLMDSLRAGRICIVDISQMRGEPALILSGLILQRIFDHNQMEFTKANPRSIPTIAVLEEAQSVLSGTGAGGEGPYISWVKEGRKYDLGALLITQQPGSLSHEILSQGDNWFVFHLLSAGDLQAVKRANAHFSDDLLSSLLNEPIPGHCVAWSSASGKAYPIPLRVLSFEQTYTPQDPTYSRGAVETYASQLVQRFEAAMPRVTVRAEPSGTPDPEEQADQEPDGDEPGGGRTDVLRTYIRSAIDSLRTDESVISRIRGNGMPWRGVQEVIKERLPEHMSDRDNLAYRLVKPAMDEIFGNEGWETDRRERRSGSGMTTWVVVR